MSLQTERLLGGRYRLQEPIGYGGMGRVFRATDELLDRAVAVKLLDEPGPDLRPELAEARAAARLSHPGVVHVFDVGTSEGEGHGYIVMELVPGRSVAEILRDQGKLLPNEAAELAAQVADALEAIHSHGMVHCDVKPLNIIVNPTGHSKLVDFGIARATAGVSKGENFGSAAYVAPEQARGEAVDARTDVYALGAVLYEMVVGRRPFTGATTTDLVRQRLIADPLPPRSLNPRVPRDLELVVMRALAREPADRFASAAELRDALRDVISHAAAPTQPLKPVRAPMSTAFMANAASQVGAAVHERLSLPRARRARRRVVAIAAAILICLLVGLGWRVTHPAANGVPHLVGLALSEVPAALEEAGLAPADVTVLTRRVDPPYVGTVVDQQPQPGKPRSADGLQIAIGVAQ